MIVIPKSDNIHIVNIEGIKLGCVKLVLFNNIIVLTREESLDVWAAGGAGSLTSIMPIFTICRSPCYGELSCMHAHCRNGIITVTDSLCYLDSNV